MAAAIVPLVLTLAPALIDLISSLVHKHAPVAEQTGGPGTGAVKFADVFTEVMKDLLNAKVAGTIPLLPEDSIVKVIIQAVVNSMKLSGKLGGVPSVPVAPSSQSIVLLPGQTLLVTA